MKHDINNLIIEYLKAYDPVQISVFGSYARNEDNPDSDIDILVRFSKRISLFDLGGIKYDLTELLNRPVDLVTENGLNEKIRPYIIKDLKIIYE
jgi:uncharacterized protein